MNLLSRVIRGTFWVLVAVAILSAPGTPNAQLMDANNRAAGCEPAGAIDLSARVLSTTKNGPIVHVLVEITLFSRISLPATRLQYALVQGDGHGAIRFQKDLGDIPRYLARKLQHQLELDQGVRHNLAFTVLADGEDGAPLEATTYLTVNLDPTQQPRSLGDVLEYRARRLTP